MQIGWVTYVTSIPGRGVSRKAQQPGERSYDVLRALHPTRPAVSRGCKRRSWKGYPMTCVRPSQHPPSARGRGNGCGGVVAPGCQLGGRPWGRSSAAPQTCHGAGTGFQENVASAGDRNTRKDFWGCRARRCGKTARDAVRAGQRQAETGSTGSTLDDPVPRLKRLLIALRETSIKLETICREHETIKRNRKYSEGSQSTNFHNLQVL